MPIGKHRYPLVSLLSISAGLAGYLFARYSKVPQTTPVEAARLAAIFVAAWGVVVGIRWVVANHEWRRGG